MFHTVSIVLNQEVNHLRIAHIDSKLFPQLTLDCINIPNHGDGNALHATLLIPHAAYRSLAAVVERFMRW
jgi:hypothetical protein